MTNLQRIRDIAKKLDGNKKAMDIAIQGLTSANKGNIFWNKSDAMLTINQLRKQNKQLAKIYNLEFSL